MNVAGAYFESHAPEYIALLGLFLVAVIANMPHPDLLKPLIGEGWLYLGYKWMFDSLQAFMSARNPVRPTPPEPVTPEIEKKD